MDFATSAEAIGIPVALVAFGSGGTLAVTATERSALLFARLCFVAGVADVLGFTTAWAIIGTSPCRWLANIPIWGIALPALVVILQWIGDREWLYSPSLKPASEAMPPLPNGFNPKADALLVFFGTNVGGSTDMPHTVLQFDAEPVLTVDKDKRGNLLISTIKIFDERGDIVVWFDKHKYQTGPTAMRPNRPDPHTIEVYDRRAQEVLRLSFINPRAIVVRGIFRHPNHRPVTIADDRAVINGGSMKGCVFYGNKVDIRIS